MGIWLLQYMVSIFLAILFLQSGADKVLDWRGNMEWLQGHFAKSPLAGVVAPMLAVVTFLELTAGSLCAAGAVDYFLNGRRVLAFWGSVLACVTLILLFFGQRMAKDYDGAAVIPSYFLVAAVGVYLLG